MSLTINSNQASSISLRSIQRSQDALERALAKLSTGQKAPSARYDATGVALSSRIRGEIAGLSKQLLNAQQGIALLQTAEGVYQRANDMLVRMRSLAAQAQGGNLSATERGMLDTEYQQIKNEMTRMAKSSTFAATKLFESNDISFADYNSYNVSGSGNTIIADYNGDGINDILTANSAGTVIASYGIGDGTFGAATTIATGLVNPNTIVTADVDGDGISDFAVTTTTGVHIFRNNGSGAFTQIGTLTGAPSTSNLTALDIDGDGKTDFVTAQNGNYHTFKNNGTGTSYTLTTGSIGFTVTSVLAGDVNNDGIADLVFNSGTQVMSALGNGSTYSNSTIFSVLLGSPLGRGVLTDIDGDGLLDVAYSGTTSIYTVKGNGGNWVTTNTLASGMLNVAGVYAGDLNGDGITDLAAYDAATVASTMRYYAGTGGFTFAGGQGVVTGTSGALTVGMVFGDLDNDGRLDMVVRKSGVLSSILNDTVMGLEGSVRVGNTAANGDNVGFRMGSTRLNALDNQLEFSMINTIGGAKRAEQSLKRALNQLLLFRTEVGSAVNRLEKVQENIATMLENQEGARSAISDLDVADEMSNYTAQQIVLQAGISMLAQTRKSQQLISKLLEKSE